MAWIWIWVASLLSSIPGFISRVYTLFNPPHPSKSTTAIRLALLGASNIAPTAVINPAVSHPDVIITAVAARDKSKAEAYAKKHNIPIVHATYDALLEDPTIDAVYIALPNGLHAEWALKALRVGKHVLLEKPSTSNGAEARLLFNSSILDQPGAPVLLEAFHYRFHPAFSVFKALVGDPGNIETASARGFLPRYIFPLDDIRFKYDLAGGALMDLGTYTVSWLRHVMEAEPEECIAASYTPMPAGYVASEPHTELGMKAAWRFPGGAVGDIEAHLASTGGAPWRWLLPGFLAKWLPTLEAPYIRVELKDSLATGKNSVTLADGEEHRVKRTVTFWVPIMPVLWHRIDLEEFVNAVKKRQGSGVWISRADSVAQMDMIDSAYRSAGLPLRASRLIDSDASV
ncbi:D-xylose 1-dehydrogenase (NADP(+)) 2 [Cytospora mali]|uniref:D-xylose 1-dehydrogenase (NADP(+), D-xylono-1,5-lactone-forming) n=1 Tax=Cytospora mali TaxID=578113 RepID=A0A194VFD4_CYTMA|nr:D-xylose 1-dehydrogenase (NADP(+)) 2 [Valsa mali var. pyri (nom. inval.)]